MSRDLTPRDLPKQAKSPQTPVLKPEVGQFVTMFLAKPYGWQNDLGTGWRNFIVLKVGRKWLTLFNPARLKSFEIDFAEWEELRPRVYFPGAESLVYLANAIPEKVAQFQSYSMQHRAACTSIALDIVNKQLEKLR